jgi:hypothetical protein
MLDADMETTRHRAKQLADALEDARKACPPKEQHHYRPPGVKDPIAVLIPKRDVETWICALLGNLVDEVTDYTRPTPTPNEIRDAAAELHQWTRPGAAPVPTYPTSLKASLPEWQKIPP